MARLPVRHNGIGNSNLLGSKSSRACDGYATYRRLNPFAAESLDQESFQHFSSKVKPEPTASMADYRSHWIAKATPGTNVLGKVPEDRAASATIVRSHSDRVCFRIAKPSDCRHIKLTNDFVGLSGDEHPGAFDTADICNRLMGYGVIDESATTATTDVGMDSIIRISARSVVVPVACEVQFPSNVGQESF